MWLSGTPFWMSNSMAWLAELPKMEVIDVNFFYKQWTENESRLVTIRWEGF